MPFRLVHEPEGVLSDPRDLTRLLTGNNPWWKEHEPSLFRSWPEKRGGDVIAAHRRRTLERLAWLIESGVLAGAALATALREQELDG